MFASLHAVPARWVGWGFGLCAALALSACAAQPAPSSPQRAPQTPPGLASARSQGQSAAPHTAAFATATASAATAQPTPCGLPAELVARGWPRRLAPVVPTRPDAPIAGSVTVAVLPDTQYYVLCRYPHLHVQVAWLADHATSLNLQAAIQLGDLTETNDPKEWEFLREGLAPLWNALPTFLATGNHDYGDEGTANQWTTRFPQFFSNPPAPTAKALVATQTPGDLENAYYQVRLPRVTLGVLILGWSPRQATVAWANAVLAKHPNDRVIVATHAYLYSDSTRYDWKAKGETQEWNVNAYGTGANNPDVYDGERLWTELVSRHRNVFLTLNGHVLSNGSGLLSSKAPGGNVVHQVLANYQMLDEGGLGYLRLMEFDPDGTTLRMRTYSPSLKLWATATDQHFDLTVSPPLW